MHNPPTWLQLKSVLFIFSGFFWLNLERLGSTLEFRFYDRDGDDSI